MAAPHDTTPPPTATANTASAETAGGGHAPNHHAHHPPFAGVTGLLAALTMLAGRRDHIDLALGLARPRPGDTLLDVGCGPGTAARRAARAGARVVGVDPAPVMLRVARLLSRRGRITFREGRAEALPVPDASVDVLWSIATVHHWSDVDSGLREARRVLVPGGRFVAIERRTRPGATGLASHGWTDEQATAFATALTDAGFADARVERRTTRRRALVAVSATRPAD